MARRSVTREHLGMARTDRHEVPLTVEEVELLVEALDSCHAFEDAGSCWSSVDDRPVAC